MQDGLTLVNGRMRGATVTLALAAVLFVLARPVCAAQEIHATLPQVPAVAHEQDSPLGSDHSPLCCESIEAGAIATSSALAVPAVAAALTVPPVAHVQVRAARVHTLLAIPPPPPLPYYARSARILR